MTADDWPERERVPRRGQSVRRRTRTGAASPPVTVADPELADLVVASRLLVVQRYEALLTAGHEEAAEWLRDWGKIGRFEDQHALSRRLCARLLDDWTPLLP